MPEQTTTQPWTTFSASLPQETLTILEAALVLALPSVLGCWRGLDRERSKDRDVRWRCLEMIAHEYINRFTERA